MPMMAQLLSEAGKAVVAWVEQDVPDELARLRREGHCAAILLHDESEGKQNLEQALAASASLPALTQALEALAKDRGYTWEAQRRYLVSAAHGVGDEERNAIKEAGALDELFSALDEADVRALIAAALSSKSVTPFEMKGARQGRIVAEAIVHADGRVPEPFERAIRAIDAWIAGGCAAGTELSMAS